MRRLLTQWLTGRSARALPAVRVSDGTTKQERAPG